MKFETWIRGSLALTVGLLPLITPAAWAQNGVANKSKPTQTTPKTVASSAPTLPSILVWGAQATNASRVGPWGNGSAEVTRGRTGTTLQVKTLNLEEGARFDLAKPIDLTPYKGTGFWQIKFQNSATSQRGGRGGRNRTQGAAAQQTAPLTQLRLKLVLDQGVMAGTIPLRQSGRGGRGGQWQNLLLPIRSFSSSPGASGLVRRIVLTGDSTASFSLEQFSLVAETNRITATVRRSTDPVGSDIKTITVKPGRSTTLVADVNGGTSDLNVSWNFNADNSVAFPPLAATGRGAAGRATTGRTTTGRTTTGRTTTGRPPVGPSGSSNTATAVARPRVDAVGLTARPNWPNEEQDYRVEVTITDRARKKPAVKKSILVQVRGGA